MKIKKIALSIVTVALMILSSVSPVFASYNFVNPYEQNRERETHVIEAILNGTALPEGKAVDIPAISPRWTCTECSWFMLSVCAMEGYVDSIWTHTYSFTKSCATTLLTSKAGFVCPTCYKVDPIDGRHSCVEVHKDCSIGVYDLCFCEVS